MTTSVSSDPQTRRGSVAALPLQLAELRGMLEQQRSFRIDQLARLRHVDAAGLLRGVEREVNDSLVAGARTALREVVDALQRMESGRYGSCRDCGAPIELERLELLPQVALCIPCQRGTAQ